MLSLIGTLRRSILLAAACGLATPVLAQTATAPSDGRPDMIRAQPVPKALDDSDMATTRGGQVVVIGNQSLTSTISGSTINGNYAAGAITFSDNALSNFNGLGNVVVNTGAQANLQSAMNLTINLAEPPS